METKRPRVSVVIPCRNESQSIEACLRSLLAQKLPSGGFEVIVADGMSDDGTRDVLERVASKTDNVRIVDNPRRITSCGLNIGIRRAQGRYIAIMGAHNHYAPDYLWRSVEVLEKTGADNVGGAMICEGRSYTQQAIAAAHHSRFSVGARWHDTDYEGPAETVFGGVYRREIFDRIGLFDEELVRNQDDEFNLRLIRAGGKIWQTPLVKSWYTPRASLKDLFRQYLQYGYWKVRVIQKHKLPASIRHLVPASFVLSLILVPIVSFWWNAAIWLWLAMVALYVVCNTAASSLVAIPRHPKLLLILPFVFGCYHIAWGYGFIRGVWDFVILRRRPRPAYTALSRVEYDHR